MPGRGSQARKGTPWPLPAGSLSVTFDGCPDLSARILVASPEGVLVTDARGTILQVNPAFTRITGYAAEEAIGRTPALLRSGRQSRTFYRKLWQSLQTEGAWRGEFWNRRKDGVVYPQQTTIFALRDRVGRIDHYVSIFSDITERKRAERRLRHLAMHDFLTGLPNRLLFLDRLEHALSQARRARAQVAVLYLDLDRFKPINDALGHQAGDAVLHEVARRLESCLRRSDTVCRAGGDEFLMVLPDLRGVEGAVSAAEKILQGLAGEIPAGGYRCRVGASLGISLYPRDGRTAEALIRGADSAMYAAKQEGGNRFRFASPDL